MPYIGTIRPIGFDASGGGGGTYGRFEPDRVSARLIDGETWVPADATGRRKRSIRRKSLCGAALRRLNRSKGS